MQCPHCGSLNDESRALCEMCGMPLTAYGKQLTGEVSAATRAKAAKLAIKPVAISPMAVYCLLVALGGPVWRLLSLFKTRTQVNEEGTNYLGAAFGAVGLTFTAILLVPLAIALLIVAWGILTQRTWAWVGGLLVVLVGLFTAFTGYFFGVGLLRFLVIVGGVGLAIFWLRGDVREWYGA